MTETHGLMQALLSEESGTAGSSNHRDAVKGSLAVPFVNFQMDELGKLYVFV